MASPAALLLEAKAEFDAWEAAGKAIAVQIGSVVYIKRSRPKILWCQCGKRTERRGLCGKCRTKERATRRPPCPCGKPYFARSLCRPCYYKEVNKTRRRNPPRLKGLCSCGRAALLTLGICDPCYHRPISSRRRRRERLMRRLENEAYEQELAA
jgi:hypothetical protein